MDDSMKTESRLEVSVSFGRFENDELSWEKWSSFSPNKYLEEVGNLSAPGSVAQKKAYFEAHYKKIAAKKAEEEMEQEKSTGPVSPSPDASIEVDCSSNTPEPKIKINLFDGEKLVEEVVTVKMNADVFNEAKCDNNDRLNGFSDVINLDEKKDKVNSAVVKCESSEIEESEDELSVSVDGPELNVGKDSVSVVLKTPCKEAQDIVEKQALTKNGREQQTSVLKKENPKSSARNITQKVTPIRKEKNSVTPKKKITLPVTKVTKPLQAATPRFSKPALTSTPVSASRALKKNVNTPQLPKSNNFSAWESKRATPTSLHMSLSLGPTNLVGGPTNLVGGPTMTRKSLIMESMGDKDIVRRAFKTFQNRSNGSMGDEKTSTVKHVASTSLEPKVSGFHTPTKGNIGLRKGTEKTATPRSHTGAKSNPLPTVSYKSSSVGKKNTTAVSPHTGLNSEEKSEKQKLFLKNLEAKSIAREAANAQFSAKSRVGVANDIHQRPTLSR